jgi:hypothetical protein
MNSLLDYSNGFNIEQVRGNLLTLDKSFAGSAAFGKVSTIRSEGAKDGASEGNSTTDAPVGATVSSTLKQT